MKKSELDRLLRRRVQVGNADLIDMLAQARALIDARPARITLFPDTHGRNAKRVNTFIRSRAARAGITVVELDPEAIGDYKCL